jgi:hypothetical protein
VKVFGSLGIGILWGVKLPNEEAWGKELGAVMTRTVTAHRAMAPMNITMRLGLIAGIGRPKRLR